MKPLLTIPEAIAGRETADSIPLGVAPSNSLSQDRSLGSFHRGGFGRICQ